MDRWTIPPSGNETPHISNEPLTPEEEDRLRRLAWEYGTDEDRAALKRAGYDYSDPQEAA